MIGRMAAGLSTQVGDDRPFTHASSRCHGGRRAPRVAHARPAIVGPGSAIAVVTGEPLWSRASVAVDLWYHCPEPRSTTHFTNRFLVPMCGGPMLIDESKHLYPPNIP